MTELSFDVFLCHNSDDKPAVEKIAIQLRDRGLRPWLDIWELRPGLALTSGAHPDFTEAAKHLDRAVDGLRQGGRDDHLPRGLLARAALHRLRSPKDAVVPDAAASDLREAQDIAERGHMRLHEADVHLEWTRLHLHVGDPDAARPHFERAKELVASTGYGRRASEVASLERRLKA